MIPYYRALNYVNLGDRQAAQVEARKAGLILAESVEALFRGGADDAGAAKNLERNAFLSYFAGLVFEWSGEVNDAFVAYSNAARAYDADRDRLGVPIPEWLGDDLRRTGDRLGFGAELRKLQEQIADLGIPDRNPQGPTSQRGTVALFVEGGWVPHQVQRTLNLPILSTDRGGDYDAWAANIALRAGPGWVAPYGVSIRYWLTVALPDLVGGPNDEPLGARVNVPAAGRGAESQLIEDLGTRTRMLFDASYPRVLTRSIVRALVKWAASEGARREDEAAGVLVNLLGVLSEKADTRSWLTLPGGIALVRVDLPPGRYDLEVSYLDAGGRVVATETISDVDVVAGDWSFYSRRIF